MLFWLFRTSLISCLDFIHNFLNTAFNIVLTVFTDTNNFFAISLFVNPCAAKFATSSSLSDNSTTLDFSFLTNFRETDDRGD